MSLVRLVSCKKLFSSPVVKRLLLNNAKCFGIQDSSRQIRLYSDIVSDDYDYTHLAGPEQTQPDVLQPLSPERRAELAAKYNLRPEDYEPLIGSNGDYPKLPTESVMERDPYYDWDDPYLRRNWGEPIFHDITLYEPITGMDTRPPCPYDRSVQWKGLLSFIFGMVFIFVLGELFPRVAGAAPKQYPEYYHYKDSFVSKEDLLENIGTPDVRVRERQQVVNYTFEKKFDDHGH